MIESIKHFICIHPVVSGCIIVVAGGWLIALILTVIDMFIGPDPAPTDEEREQIARADDLLKELDEAKGGDR